MFLLYALLLVIILCCSLVIFYIVLYNRIQNSITKVEQAESIIDDCLRNRYDLILSANNIVENNVKDKKNLLKGVSKIKDENISNFDLDRKLSEYVVLLKQLKNDYEALSSNKEYKKILNDIKKIDERIQATKTYYNKYTNSLNEQIRIFPSNVIAKMHNISIRNFFDGKDIHDDILDDFKF